MSNRDLCSSLFWLVFSIILTVESYRLDIGDFHNPGPGFLPFWAGVIFAILSSVLIIMNLNKKRGDEDQYRQKKWKNLIFVIVILYIYAILVEKLGFIIITFLFVGVLLTVIERKKFYIAALFGVISALVAYIIFHVWLQTQLPRGILGI